MKIRLYKNPPPYFIILASSVKTKEVEVIEFHRIELSQGDNHGITETWLNSNILDSELFPEHYNVHRKDREHAARQKRGGDILMTFKIISCRRADLESDCEIMVCDMQVSNVKK